MPAAVEYYSHNDAWYERESPTIEAAYRIISTHKNYPIRYQVGFVVVLLLKHITNMEDSVLGEVFTLFKYMTL